MLENPYTKAKPSIHLIIDALNNRVATVFWRIWSAFEDGYDEGATAYHEAVVKWLWEPCTENHSVAVYSEGKYTGVARLDQFYYGDNNREHWVHHKDCPDCMKEFKEV